MSKEADKPVVEAEKPHELHEVAPGYVLHVPERYASDTPLWLRAGGVLDLADPFVRVASAGQSYKLRPIVERRESSPLPRALVNARAQFAGVTSKVETRVEVARSQGASRASAAGIDADIPAPDIPVRDVPKKSPSGV